MLYSAMAIKGVEVYASDNSHLGHVVDAYAHTETGVVEKLIIDASTTGEAVSLFPADQTLEYDTIRRRLKVNLTPEQAASMPPVAKGIPVVITRPEGPSDAQLRVISSVVGYMVEAVDGPVGQAADFLVDSDGLVMRYLVVDTRDWLPGSDKLVPVEWIESIDWVRHRIFLKITQARTRSCQRASAGSHLLDQS
jgi:hypothetical protein